MDSKKQLYIPVKTLDSDDLIEGIGILEIAICNNLVGIGFAVFSTIATVSTIRRDNCNENLIQKIMFILRFLKKQKIYLFDRSGEEIL